MYAIGAIHVQNQWRILGRLPGDTGVPLSLGKKKPGGRKARQGKQKEPRGSPLVQGLDPPLRSNAETPRRGLQCEKVGAWVGNAERKF